MGKDRRGEIRLDVFGLGDSANHHVFNEDDNDQQHQVSDRACAICWSLTSVVSVLALIAAAVVVLWGPDIVADTAWFSAWRNSIIISVVVGMTVCCVSMSCGFMLCMHAFGYQQFVCCDCETGVMSPSRAPLQTLGQR